ncbi:ABC transporter ATP-binding protein [Nisaea acidiphila]|uniref:ABC transporter ATP-binding protein n=1 Tax=Nisaea acidiphila TaxID=1862145 RepID=A0A9J7B1R2_9PROT|nr:ABC transporter ATP-binding protein [Nisaea acidiphila]UUX51605.1 ABC transporter ATP-binding protein [Nisaea acidiphila]
MQAVTSISSVGAENLSLSIGRRTILHGIDLPPVHRGEVLAIVGPNGAGKSSLMHCLCGLAKFDGRLLFDGVPVPAPARERRAWAPHIGYVPQNTGIRAKISVMELLLSAQKSHTRSVAVHKKELERAERVLERLDIMHLGQRLCPTLSGGQMQMVALAQALVLSPTLLLLDEPTSALDLRHQSQSLKLIRNYVRKIDEGGTPRAMALVILHDLNLALRYADRVLVIDDGRVSAHGALPETLSLDVVQRTFGVEGEFVQDSRGEQVLVAY